VIDLENDFPVDAVVLWVDDTDENWVKKRNKYTRNKSLNADNRYRDLGIFQYWFKLIQKNAPFFRKIFLITDNQVPNFVIEDERVILVNHTDFIPENYLPTFNTNVIEMSLGFLDDLSEHFVLFNDDMFLIKPVSKKFFFSKEGMPTDIGVFNILQPTEYFTKLPFNNLVVLNSHFSKKNVLKQHPFKFLNFRYGKRNIQTLLTLAYPSITGFFEHHQPQGYLKNNFIKMEEQFPEIFSKLRTHKFRTSDDYTEWLIREWNLLEGNFKPRSPKVGTVVTIRKSTDLKLIEKKIRNKRIRTLVINDKEMSTEEFSVVKDGLSTIFEELI
jgi:hypothetical protein